MPTTTKNTQATQRSGGIAALTAAATFVFGFALFATVMSDYTTGDPDAATAAQNGLGGGHEAVGALWILLVSVTALRTRALPAALNSIGVAAGLAGVVTVVPALQELGAIFGLGLIIWFVGFGVHMLRAATPSPTRRDQHQLAAGR